MGAVGRFRRRPRTAASSGDAATYYTLGHSLATDLDFEYRRDDLARVWKEFPSGPEGLFLKRGSGGRIFYAKAYIYPLAGGAVHLVVRHERVPGPPCAVDDACFLCAYSFLAARSHPVAALIFAFAFLFVSLVPIYMVQLGPDFFIFAIVLVGYFFWCYKEVGAPPAESAKRLAHAMAAGAALGYRGGGLAWHRHLCQADERRA